MKIPKRKLPTVTEKFHAIEDKMFDEDLSVIDRLRFFIDEPTLDGYEEELIAYGYNYSGAYTDIYVFTRDSEVFVRRAYTMTRNNEDGHDASAFATEYRNVCTKEYDESFWCIDDSVEEMLL